MSPSGRKPHILSFSWRDFAIFCSLFTSAVLLCILLHKAKSSEGFAYSISILTVLLISRFTTGYLYGTLAAVLSVVVTNYIFTYPYWEVDFTLSGYPLTFLTMLVVSLVTCTMTTKIKKQENLRIEAAREKMKANLLRSVSHDIRTPLTSIIGSTSAMLENPDLPEEDRMLLLGDVKDDAQWLIRVVENLLSITRMGDATTRLVKNPEPAGGDTGRGDGKVPKALSGAQGAGFRAGGAAFRADGRGAHLAGTLEPDGERGRARRRSHHRDTGFRAAGRK